MPIWKKIVKCYNPYQNFSDWFFGRWRCPKCGTLWEGIGIFDDLTLLAIANNKIIERRLECLECGFEKIVWKRKV